MSRSSRRRTIRSVPAGLTLGPKNSPLVEFGVLGFLAIRSNGIAADLVLTTNTSLPLGLASVDATAVFIVNTTGDDVVFEIPGGATDPNRPTGPVLDDPERSTCQPERDPQPLAVGCRSAGADHR